jgi:cell division control protein 6
MLAIIEAWRQNARTSLDTGDAYAAYREVCTLAGHQQLSPRAFGDLIGELGLYSFVRVRVLSRGRHGRTRDIVLDLPQDVRDRIRDVILLNLGLQRSS